MGQARCTRWKIRAARYRSQREATARAQNRTGRADDVKVQHSMVGHPTLCSSKMYRNRIIEKDRQTETEGQIKREREKGRKKEREETSRVQRSSGQPIGQGYERWGKGGDAPVVSKERHGGVVGKT